MPDIQTTTRSSDPAPTPMCDYEGCDQVAAYAYTWAWGATGYCCAKHAVVYQQKAQALKRTIALTALVPGAPAPVTREERTQLHAARLAAEEEAREVKQRNAELYGANQQLAKELNRQRTAIAELESQLKDAAKQIDQLLTDRREASAKLASTTDEVVRLESLLHAHQVGP